MTTKQSKEIQLVPLNTNDQICWSQGYTEAQIGGKLRNNPYIGGPKDEAIQWWSWNEGYKAYKRIEATIKRKELSL